MFQIILPFMIDKNDINCKSPAFTAIAILMLGLGIISAVIRLNVALR